MKRSTSSYRRSVLIVLPLAMGTVGAVLLAFWPILQHRFESAGPGRQDAPGPMLPATSAVASPSPSAEKGDQDHKDARPVEQVGNNPLFRDYQELAAPHQIDVSFTRDVTVLGPADPGLSEDALNFPVFCNAPGSLDVLLVGDSTMSWGVIPRVIQGLTGLRVGMFSFRAMYLNERTLRVVRRVHDQYVREGGLTIFGFDVWTQSMEPEAFRRGELLRLENMSDSEFRAFAEQRFAECGKRSMNVKAHWVNSRKRGLAGVKEDIMRHIRRVASTDRLALLPFSTASLKEYSAILTIVRNRLRLTEATEEHPLAHAFREWIHPAWFNASRSGSAAPTTGAPAGKPVPDTLPASGSVPVASTTPVTNNRQDAPSRNDPPQKERISLSDIQFIRWDRETFTLTGPFRARSIRSSAPGYDGYPVSHQQLKNARSLLEFPGRKAFLITFYSRHDLYMQQRSIYSTLYRDRLELIDLGRLHPDDRQFSMDEANHPANTGGMAKSILMGLWLRDHFFTQVSL